MTTLAVLVGSTVTGGTDIGIAGAFSSAIGGTDDDIRLVGLDAVAAVMLSDKRPGESPPDLPEGPRRSQGGPPEEIEGSAIPAEDPVALVLTLNISPDLAPLLLIRRLALSIGMVQLIYSVETQGEADLPDTGHVHQAVCDRPTLRSFHGGLSGVRTQG